MPRPGVTVELVDDAPSGQAVLDSGQAFFVGIATTPPAEAVRLRSLAEYEDGVGPRTEGQVLYDSVAAYFAEGGAVLYVAAAAAEAGVDDALDLFPYELGPGQVAAPGITTTAVQDALLLHAEATRRVVLLDAADDDDVVAITAAATRLHGDPRARSAAFFAPWAVYPGPAVGSTTNVPYSAVQAGLIARSDAATQNPNLAAAGVNGIARGALGLTQTYADADREDLNEAGVTVAVTKYGTIRTYGARSVAGPDELTWMWFGGAREVMTVAHQADAVGENYVLKQIDGQGALFASFNADLKGMLLEHYGRGALYGATPEEAFSVNTGASVNTPTTIAAGEIHAVIRLKTSPTAEWVHVVVVKTALDRPIAA